MKSIVFAAVAAVALTSNAVQAEIICTEQGGCWETGKKIRLPSSPYRGVDTTVTSRENPNSVVAKTLRVAFAGFRPTARRPAKSAASDV